MGKNKWKQFEGRGCTIIDLGRAAVFALPEQKLKQKIGKTTVADRIKAFLEAQYGAYTCMPCEGSWRGVTERGLSYEVSFLGKHRLPKLIREITRIARLTNEECIYLKAGQYSCLIYPR